MPEEILDSKFDLSSSLRELRIGYTELSQKKVDLELLIVNSNAELEATKSQLETVSKILAVAGIPPETDLSRPRQSNLSAIATGVVLEVFSNPAIINVPESELIRLVLAESSTAKEKSVQSVLYKLSEKADAFGGTKCLRRSGKRGSYVYSLQIDLGSDFTEAPLESPKDPLVKRTFMEILLDNRTATLNNKDPHKVSSVTEFQENLKKASEAREARESEEARKAREAREAREAGEAEEAEKVEKVEKAIFEDRIITSLLIHDPVNAVASLSNAVHEAVKEHGES